MNDTLLCIRKKISFYKSCLEDRVDIYVLSMAHQI